jgi:hypothetical protein
MAFSTCLVCDARRPVAAVVQHAHDMSVPRRRPSPTRETTQRSPVSASLYGLSPAPAQQSTRATPRRSLISPAAPSNSAAYDSPARAPSVSEYVSSIRRDIERAPSSLPAASPRQRALAIAASTAAADLVFDDMRLRLHAALELRADGFAAVHRMGRDVEAYRGIQRGIDAARDNAAGAAVAKHHAVQRLVGRVEQLEAELAGARAELAERAAAAEGLHHEVLELRSAKQLADIVALTDREAARVARRRQ